jgi:hypothetical protein
MARLTHRFLHSQGLTTSHPRSQDRVTRPELRIASGPGFGCNGRTRCPREAHCNPVDPLSRPVTSGRALFVSSPKKLQCRPVINRVITVLEVGVPVHDAGSRISELGGVARHRRWRQILNGPMEVPGGQLIVNCMDPQSATFSRVAMKR